MTLRLANTSWTLTSFGPPGAETPVLAGWRIILEFGSSDQASGSAGCNRYHVRYQIQGNVITFPDGSITKAYCFNPVVMKQEDQYLAALRTIGKFELAADSLTISYNDGKGVLHFTSHFTRGTPGK
jgi:heat shock protein HslJ